MYQCATRWHLIPSGPEINSKQKVKQRCIARELDNPWGGGGGEGVLLDNVPA